MVACWGGQLSDWGYMKTMAMISIEKGWIVLTTPPRIDEFCEIISEGWFLSQLYTSN